MKQLKRQVTARVMLLILLPLFSLVSACGNEKSSDELNSVKSRVEYIEKRLDGTLFLNLYSFSWLRWKQVFGANGGSP